MGPECSAGSDVVKEEIHRAISRLHAAKCRSRLSVREKPVTGVFFGTLGGFYRAVESFCRTVKAFNRRGEMILPRGKNHPNTWRKVSAMQQTAPRIPKNESTEP